jgi:hypothetical protein
MEMPSKTVHQISLDFDGAKNCEPTCSEDGNIDSDDSNAESAESDAVVFSFADKVAKKVEAHESRLYEGILSRIKHLKF